MREPLILFFCMYVTRVKMYSLDFIYSLDVSCHYVHQHFSRLDVMLYALLDKSQSVMTKNR